jgi:hypothetical protein
MKHLSGAIIIRFAICLFLMTTASFAQKTLILDFKTKTFNNLKEIDALKEGDTYQLQIININTFLYNISVQTRDTITQRELKFPGFGSFDLSPINAITGNLSPLKTFIPEISLTQPKGIRVPSIRESINDEQINIKNAKIYLELVKTHIDLLFFTAKKFILSALVEDTATGMYKKLGGNAFSIDTFIHDIDSIRLSLAERQKWTVDRYTRYTKIAEIYQDSIKNVPEIKKGDAEIKTAYEELIKTIGVALASVDADKCMDNLTKIIDAENNRKYEYVSLPFQLKGDQIKMHITIAPREKTSSLQAYSTDFVFPREKNWFIGVGSSFYISSLHDDAYSTVTISTDTSYKVIKENPGSLEIGMQAMMMIGFCPSDWGYAYASFGPGISISNKVKPRLLLGAGYAFGKRNLITVGANLIVGAVDRKSEAIQLDTRYDQKPDQITVSRIEYGVSITVGYVFNL